MTAPRIRIRGIRQRAPTGYVLGRLDPGDGEVQLIAISHLGSKLVGSGIVAPGPSTGAIEEILSVTMGGPFTANQTFAVSPAPRSASFPGPTADIALASVAPTGSCNIMLCSNVATFLASGGTTGVFCQIAWTAGSLIGVTSYPNGGVLTAGDVLTFVCPADATLSGISLNLYGTL